MFSSTKPFVHCGTQMAHFFFFAICTLSLLEAITSLCTLASLTPSHTYDNSVCTNNFSCSVPILSIFIFSFVLPARESKQDLTSYASICSKYCSFPCACCLHCSHLHSNLGKCLLSRTWTEETVSATGRSSRQQQRLSMPSPSQETHGETSYFKPDPPDVEQCSFLMAGTLLPHCSGFFVFLCCSG